MINFPQLLTDSAVYVAIATILLLGLVLYNPRLMLQDYPPAIKKTETEKRQSTLLGLPFLLTILVLPFIFAFRLTETSFPALFAYAWRIFYKRSVLCPYQPG